MANQSSPSGGMRDPIEVARKKAEWILNNHHPQALETNQQKELTRILAGADQEIGGRE